LPAIFRLVAQAFASFLLWSGGWRLSGPPPVFASMAANCCLVVLFVNAFNWWDGMDGLAAGTACVTAVCYALLPSSAMSPLGFATALSLAGTCAAFLLFNWHPRASIFLGDCGSTVLGFLIVCLGLDFSRTQSSSRASVLFMLVLAALPVLDAARVIACRIAGGGSALQGDRTHFYDLILKSGYSARRIAVLSWCVTALCGGFAVFIERRASSELWLLALLALVAVWLVANAALSRKNAGNCEVSEPI
jgi:UDP-GlcNAc:undecaprenyl-phosphate/decaprenyl-phosphate GlcNAc-1-phosphate transferase